MGIGSKLFLNTKSSRISPQFDGVARARSGSISSDDNESVSTGLPTPGSVASFATASSSRSAISTWASPRSSRSLVSAKRRHRPTTDTTLHKEGERKKWTSNRNDLSHLVAPVMPWPEFIAIYVEFLTSNLGGSKKSWTDFMSLGTSDIRIALAMSGNITSVGKKKPWKLPQGVAETMTTLLRELPKASTEDTGKLSFTLHTRPFYCTSLNPHVELLLWAVVSMRNGWFKI